MAMVVHTAYHLGEIWQALLGLARDRPFGCGQLRAKFDTIGLICYTLVPIPTPSRYRGWLWCMAGAGQARIWWEGNIRMHRLRRGVVFLLVVLALAACGPAATPTTVAPEPTDATAAGTTPVPATEAPAATAITQTTPGEDWRSKGAADAPVVIEEYSDFQ